MEGVTWRLRCAWRAFWYPPNPPPLGTGGDLWLEVIEREKRGPAGHLVPMMRERRTLGWARYKRLLHRENGRDFALDLADELLDAMVYAEGLGGVEGRVVSRVVRDALVRLVDKNPRLLRRARREA